MMKRLTLFLFLFLHLNLFAQSPELIFNSGFEPATDTIDHDSSSVDIIGVDASVSAPNDWENHLDDHPNIGTFKIQFKGGDETDRLAEIVPDPINPSNNALQFWIENPNSGNNGRIQGNIYDNTGLHNIYYSVRLFLPGDFNLLKEMDDDFSFMTLMEFWNNANWSEEDYMFRIKVNLAKVLETEDSLKISITGQVRDEALDKWGEHIYDVINPDFIVPVQKWMTLKVYFVEGDDCSGRFVLTITPDGDPETTVLNVRNFTHHPDDPNPDGLSHINPIKLYCDDEIVDYVRDNGGLLNVFWDDFELWKDVEVDTDDSCLPLGIVFESQSDIDNFATNYPGCQNIEGNVTIESGATDITNLDGLNQITSIRRSLTIQSNNSLTNLSGLENITCLNGDLYIDSNNSLSDISALSKIRSLGGFLQVSNNDALTSLSGLEKIAAIDGSITISNNGMLTSLTGLESIDYTTITNLIIENSTNLSSCELKNICSYLENSGPVSISGNAMGCVDESEVEAACLLLLPVELIHFSGKEVGGNAALSWKTASEMNNDYFQIEHSVDGKQFSPIGKIEGKGTTSQSQEYYFLHREPAQGINYYRLKQVDFDGGFEHSAVISINVEFGGLVIQPNPTNGNVEIMNNILGEVNLKITDGMGRLIHSKNLTTHQTINLSDQPIGIYFFIIQTTQNTIVKRIVKQ